MFIQVLLLSQSSAYAIIPAYFSLLYESDLRVFYNIVFTLAVPFILLRLLWRGTKASAYFKRWDERFAITLPSVNKSKSVIWVHAVSMGEVEACRPLVAGIQSTYPEHQILITTMTPTGSTRVKALYADDVIHCYLPYDLPVIMRRFIQAIQPVFGVIMETELWPNLIHHCRKQNIPLVLANARMSERSLKGYQRIPSLTREILQSFTVIAAQAQQDRERFIELGADRDKVHAVGNLKFEVNLSPTIVEQAEAIRSMWGNRSVFVAASTHEGEDEIVLNASRQIRAQVPDLLLIIVPRHPERFDKVAALCQRAGFKILRRSENGLCRRDIQILVIDSMGELPIFYACSDIAFVGGSLVPTGGHNILEPAALSRPVIVGPHVFNFAEITQQFITAQAAIQVDNAEMLATTVIELLKNPPKRTAMGEAGQQLIKQSQGGSQRLLNLIKYNIHV